MKNGNLLFFNNDAFCKNLKGGKNTMAIFKKLLPNVKVIEPIIKHAQIIEKAMMKFPELFRAYFSTLLASQNYSNKAILRYLL